MGPCIILDKSTLQSLSPDEIFILNKFYFIHITPVLLMEILGDLKKPTKNGLSEDKVKLLANKILPSDSAIGAHFMHLIIASLSGYPVEMGRRPHIAGGVQVESESGEKGVVFEVSQEEKALNNWKIGNFTEAESLLSEQWRESTKALDLEAFKRDSKQKMKILKSPRNIEQLHHYLSSFLTQEELQTGLLQSLIEAIRLDFGMAQKIFLRWEQSKYKLIKDFSPYAYFFLKVLTLFQLGLTFDLIGTRATNKIDLEYIYYLPFCMIFISNDKFHKSITGTFLSSDQAFVDGEDLKKDLANLSNEWNKLKEPRKAAWEAKYGHGPPARSDCLTYILWKRFWPKWKPGKKTERTKRSPEEEAKLIEKIRNLESSPVDHGAWKSSFDDPKVDFLIRKREVSIYDPCPCGSGKPFKDCHWPEVRESQERSRRDN